MRYDWPEDDVGWAASPDCTCDYTIRASLDDTEGKFPSAHQ